MAGKKDTYYSGRFQGAYDINGDAVDGTLNGTEPNRGFYYDCELNDPSITISLHANRYFDENATDSKTGYKGAWVPWPSEWGVLEDTNPKVNGVENKHYGKSAIAKCLMTEDMSYSIQNNFTDNNMGNPIESLFESLKPYAPILKSGATNLKKAAGDVSKAGDFGSAFARTMGNLAKGMAPWMEKAGDYLDKALMVQGTRFTFYNGSSFNFNNLEMKFTVFSDWIKHPDNSGSYYFEPAVDYVKKLNKYAMGKYNPITNDKSLKTNVEVVDNFLEQYIGFQTPPGGFEMDTKYLDNTLAGTLRLNIGGFWAIDNLVLKNMNVTFSKIMTKIPDGAGGAVTPLYAEIVLQLTPASAIVDTGYDRFLEQEGMTNVRGPIENSYRTQLNKLKEKLT